MSYDLYPKNKKVKDIRIGAFSWPIILQETGCGYLFGYGAARSPSQYVYQPDKNGGSPVSNDGYHVSARQSRIMSELCRGYISVQRFIQKEWQEVPLDRYELEWNFKSPIDGKEIYKKPAGVKFLKIIEEFAEFAEKSGGFRIH